MYPEKAPLPRTVVYPGTAADARDRQLGFQAVPPSTRPSEGFQTRTQMAPQTGLPSMSGPSLATDELEGILLGPHWTFSFGIPVLLYEPYLLLKNGRACRDLRLSPEAVKAQSDGGGNASDWGRWKQLGPRFVIRWDNGKESSWAGTTWDKKWHRGVPAKPSDRLSGRFLSIGGMSNALGTVASVKEFTFLADGRFYGEATGSVNAPSGVFAHSRRPMEGTYSLNHHTIELRRADGGLERHWFAFYPGTGREQDGDVIVIGGRTYVSRKPRR